MGDTFKCEKCSSSIGIKSVSDDRIDITPLMNGCIEKITVHRTATKEIEYTVTVKCGLCKSNTMITRIV